MHKQISVVSFNSSLLSVLIHVLLNSFGEECNDYVRVGQIIFLSLKSY